MATLNVNDTIARAIDRHDADAAGLLVDVLRHHGMTYRQILARVQAVRPGVTAAQWEDLLVGADES